jgi:MtN3 and saliva related transmembrane protein
MNTATLLGTFAALCSTISFAPQAWKIIHTRQTKDISIGMYAITVLGFALWTTYGVALKQWPLAASNSICFGLSGFILLMSTLPAPEKNAVASKIAPKKKSRR